MSKPIEYICQIDSSDIPLVDTAWTLTSPDVTIYNGTVSTAGLVTFTSGGSALNTPVVMGVDGNAHTLTISNVGILTVTTSTTPLTANDSTAALVDGSGIQWMFVYDLDGQVLITTETPLENKYYYPAIFITYQVGASNSMFELHAIKPNTTRHRR